ncbi:hypothetical protein ACN47E_005044 [Coniothyrium glycines]
MPEAPSVDPAVALILASNLKHYNHTTVKHYLVLASDDYRQLRSNQLQDKTRYVLRELHKLKKHTPESITLPNKYSKLDTFSVYEYRLWVRAATLLRHYDCNLTPIT